MVEALLCPYGLPLPWGRILGECPGRIAAPPATRGRLWVVALRLGGQKSGVTPSMWCSLCVAMTRDGRTGARGVPSLCWRRRRILWRGRARIGMTLMGWSVDGIGIRRVGRRGIGGRRVREWCLTGVSSVVASMRWLYRGWDVQGCVDAGAVSVWRGENLCGVWWATAWVERVWAEATARRLCRREARTGRGRDSVREQLVGCGWAGNGTAVTPHR